MPFLSRSVPKPTSSTPGRAPRRWAILVLGATLGLGLACLTTWFAGQPTIAQFFAYWHGAQAHPPAWLGVPPVAPVHLAILALGITLVAYGITQLSPYPQPWSRRLVVCLLLGLMGRYLVWRCLSTLNLASPLEGSFSLLLLGVELFGLILIVLQLVLLLRVGDRRAQADQLQQAVLQGHYRPWVDVLIPTYDEPAFILRRTVVGCQTMDYPYKTVYLLDDTHRPEIQALAMELGCRYLTRPDNRYAKAGNLNHALGNVQGELVACFDADFVPTRNFLCRTVGFFQRPSVGLVQTPQSFYNADPIARNLGFEGVLTPDEEVFYRQIQPMRDGSGSVVCAGTSFVVRRSALDRVGQFVTDSLSEDYFTAVLLAAQGYEVVYLNEQLSAGLAAEDIAAHVAQRLRWARGTLQGFFISANPLTIKGLRFPQRLGHLEGLMNHIASIPRLLLLLLPLVLTWLRVVPIQTTTAELLYFVLPFYLVQFVVYGWLTERSRSALLSDIYALVLVFPLAATVVQVLTRPFAKGFYVTPKGTSREGFRFNWQLGWPLLVLWALTALTLGYHLWPAFAQGGAAPSSQGLALGWLWNGYNLVMLTVALLALVDVPRPDPNVWLALRRSVQIVPQGQRPGAGAVCWGSTTQVSEVGLEAALPQAAGLAVGVAVDILLGAEAIALEGIVTAVDRQPEGVRVRVQFGPMALGTYRSLVGLLFCRPGQWRRWCSPSEGRALRLLAQALLRPRRFVQRGCRAMAVNQS